MDTTSPGVARIEAMAKHITFANRVAIFLSVFLIAFAYGLDGSVRGSYQPVAASYFNDHSLLATVGVVRSIMGAIAQVNITSPFEL